MLLNKSTNGSLSILKKKNEDITSIWCSLKRKNNNNNNSEPQWLGGLSLYKDEDSTKRVFG